MSQQDDEGATLAVRPQTRTGSQLAVVGALLLLVGVVSLGWVGWHYYGTNVTAGKAFAAERERLRQAWRDAPGAGSSGRPPTGEPMALLRIPELGPDYEVPVVAGVGDDQLARGVGWYPHSGLPGELGNFAVTGHRITHGEPFARLLELQVGSRVEVETAGAVYTYELTTAPSSLTVGGSDAWVVDPVPGQPAGTVPTERLITLTTCTDLFASPKRSVAFGRLVDVRQK